MSEVDDLEVALDMQNLPSMALFAPSLSKLNLVFS